MFVLLFFKKKKIIITHHIDDFTYLPFLFYIITKKKN